MRSAEDREQFRKRCNILEKQCNALSNRLVKLQTAVKERKRADIVGRFIFEIKERDGIIDEFDGSFGTHCR